MAEHLGIAVVQDESHAPGFVVLRIGGVTRAPLDESFTIRRADSETSSIGSDWPVGPRHPVSSAWHEERQLLELVVGPDTVNPIPGGMPVVIRLPGLGGREIALNWPDGLLLAAKENRRRGRPRNVVVVPHAEFGDGAAAPWSRPAAPPPPPAPTPAPRPTLAAADAEAAQLRQAREREAKRLEDEAAANRAQEALAASEREAKRVQAEAAAAAAAAAEQRRSVAADAALRGVREREASQRASIERAQASARVIPATAPAAARAEPNRWIVYAAAAAVLLAVALVVGYVAMTPAPVVVARDRVDAPPPPASAAAVDASCSPAHAAAGLCVAKP